MRRPRIKRAWQPRNFLKIPANILKIVENIPQSDIKVAGVKKIPEADIAAGKYAHINIRIKEGTLTFPARQQPRPSNGKYSRINAMGITIVRMDLPKYWKTFTMEAPDWQGYGTHDVDIDREVYQRDFFPAKELELEIELLDEEVVNGEKSYLFKFEVVEVLDKKTVLASKDKDLWNDLFFDLNLLQENAGVADIYASKAARADYLKTVYIDWEILPPGEREKTIARILAGVRNPTEALKKKLTERYDLLAKLKPQAFVNGASGFRRYFGAKFADNFVVFENIEYGNAIYGMFEDWKELSKKSRLELLAGNRKGFERIVHKRGWEEKLVKLVRQKRWKPAA
jgi:hypothetical protein